MNNEFIKNMFKEKIDSEYIQIRLKNNPSDTITGNIEKLKIGKFFLKGNNAAKPIEKEKTIISINEKVNENFSGIGISKM